jgi:hypothetical protein
MSSKPKFDPERVASLLSRGSEEGRGALGERPLALAAVPAPTEPENAPERARADTAANVVVKRPVTVRLTEEVLHALVRHQAEVRCQPGARLGDTTIGGVIDALLRGPLGLA